MKNLFNIHNVNLIMCSEEYIVFLILLKMKTKTASERNSRLDNNRHGNLKEDKERGKNSVQSVE